MSYQGKFADISRSLSEKVADYLAIFFSLGYLKILRMITNHTFLSLGRQNYHEIYLKAKIINFLKLIYKQNNVFKKLNA